MRHTFLKTGLSVNQLGDKGIEMILEDFSGIKGLFGPLFGKVIWDRSVPCRGNNQSKGPLVGIWLLAFLQKSKEASMAGAGGR